MLSWEELPNTELVTGRSAAQLIPDTEDKIHARPVLKIQFLKYRGGGGGGGAELDSTRM